MGADKAERVGPVNGLHYFEQKINGISKLNALMLRPAYFMENNLAQIKIIQTMRTCGGVMKGDLRFPQIATRDIGEYRGEGTGEAGFFREETRELHGQRDLTMKETAAVLGRLLASQAWDIRKFPAFAVEMAMKQMGLSEKYAKLLMEMLESINSGWMNPLEPRSAENTTPTKIETFAAEEFAPRFKGQAAGA